MSLFKVLKDHLRLGINYWIRKREYAKMSQRYDKLLADLGLTHGQLDVLREFAQTHIEKSWKRRNLTKRKKYK